MHVTTGVLPRVAGRPDVAPVAPVHQSEFSGGGELDVPQASLGSFRRFARTLALAVRVV
jgi:hypothetical protein